SEAEMFRACTKARGIPIFHNPPHIENSHEYSSERLPALKSQLQSGTFVPPSAKADAHREVTITQPDKSVTFVSVDVCGSTASRARGAAAFDRAYSILMQELGAVVGQFHGTILSSTGDGFIAIIDSPSINVQCDNAMDMGLTFLTLLRTA